MKARRSIEAPSISGRVALLILVLGAFLIFTPGPSWAQQREITVSAAASLTNAFKEIGKAFEAQNKGSRIYFNFAASGDLLRQIEGGAPVDVFASAAARELDDLERKGLLALGTRENLLLNALVLVRPASGLASLGSFADLKRAEIRRISIGNPATVPAGMYAEQVLRHFRVWDGVKGKLVFGESVRQVLDYVARGEVDAGIVFATDARVRSKEVSIVAVAPEGSHKPAIYCIGVVKGSKQADLAWAFVQFTISGEGQRILGDYGFMPRPKR